MAKNVTFQVFFHFRTPCGAEIRPEKIHVPSNRKSHKMLIFFNLMFLAHDISPKKDQKGIQRALQGPKKGCTNFHNFFYDSSFQYDFPRNLSRVFYLMTQLWTIVTSVYHHWGKLSTIKTIVCLNSLIIQLKLLCNYSEPLNEC